MLIYLFSRNVSRQEEIYVHYLYDDILGNLLATNFNDTRKASIYECINNNFGDKIVSDKDISYTLPKELLERDCYYTSPNEHVEEILEKMIFDKL